MGSGAKLAARHGDTGDKAEEGASEPSMSGGESAGGPYIDILELGGEGGTVRGLVGVLRGRPLGLCTVPSG